MVAVVALASSGPVSGQAARARGVDMADDTPVEDFRSSAEVATASAEALEPRYPGFAGLFTRIIERSNDA